MNSYMTKIINLCIFETHYTTEAIEVISNSASERSSILNKNVLTNLLNIIHDWLELLVQLILSKFAATTHLLVYWEQAYCLRSIQLASK